jgi:hypothetical protein
MNSSTYRRITQVAMSFMINPRDMASTYLNITQVATNFMIHP